MLISDYLKLRNQQIGIDTAKILPNNQGGQEKTNESGQTFAKALRDKLDESGGVEFSGHALKRINSRSIDMLSDDNKFERLNLGVELAAEKGCNEALILVDSTAFVVSVKNNMVITTLSQADLTGNVFTNIDSAVVV